MKRKASGFLSRAVPLLGAMGLSAAVLLATVFTTGESLAAKDEKVRLFSVVVGVSKFQDKSVPPLAMSAKDARDFADFVKEQGQAFSKTQVTLLVDEQATRANITDALRNQLRRAGKGDIILLYFSGHGATDPANSGEYYFVTYD
ncbi:MAG: caspase family protein, partial [Pseudomonadota bacterium]